MLTFLNARNPPIPVSSQILEVIWLGYGRVDELTQPRMKLDGNTGHGILRYGSPWKIRGATISPEGEGFHPATDLSLKFHTLGWITFCYEGFELSNSL